MTNDLIERYIYAATKRLPDKTKNDVSDELRTLIDDMLVERCGEVIPDEKDIKVVLTELGTPNELYEKYNLDTKKCLIGSPYYSTYKFVLKIVLICVCFGITLSIIIGSIINLSNINNAESLFSQQTSWVNFWFDLFVNLFSMLPSGLLWAFAFVTLLFAFFYHKDIKIDTSGNLDDLPPVPKKKQTISKWNPIIGIAISVVFLVVFLVAPQIFCAVRFTDTTIIVPIFNVETIRSTWYIIVMFAMVGIFREIVKLIEGRYNKKVMITTIVADVISAVLSVWWLSNSNIINSDFIGSLSGIFNNKSEFIMNIFENFQYFFLGCIIFALLIDVLEAVVKTLTNK